jgi:hypothetical protein
MWRGGGHGILFTSLAAGIYSINQHLIYLSTGEIKKGWPLPTVEIEAKGDSRKGILPWLVLRRASTRDFCPALAALVGPVFFPTVHYFT